MAQTRFIAINFIIASLLWRKARRSTGADNHRRRINRIGEIEGHGYGPDTDVHYDKNKENTNRLVVGQFPSQA